MRLVKLGLGSINSTVGAFARNTDKVLAQARAMAEEGCTLGAFPEQVVGGYPSEDLVQWQRFVDRQWIELRRFAHETRALPTVFALGLTVAHRGLRYNCAAVVAGGRTLGLVPKEKLPTYGVFYEGRTLARGRCGLRESFEPFDDGNARVPFGDLLFDFDFGRVAFEVCEDLWSADGPLRRRAYSGAELCVNLSASPYRIGIEGTRRELIATRAGDHQCTVAYVNSVGANDGLIFDGGAYVNQNGKWVEAGARFREGFSTAVVDLDRTSRLRSEITTWRDDRDAFLNEHAPVESLRVEFATKRDGLAYPAPSHKNFFLPAESAPVSARAALCEDILDALALGVGDYFEKTGAFKSFGIALSGGRDSLLTLLIAHRYAARVRPDNPGSLIQAFYMPSRYSSDATRVAAQTIARELGVSFSVVSIDEAFEREITATKAMLGGQELTGLTLQNIQARLRAQRMWNWSNTSNALFLQTGNMSEKAVGYTTVGGDLMGALAVIANVPKTVVMVLLEHLLAKHGYQGIALVNARPAGPELAPNQRGEEELMPFPILDACFHLFAGEKLSPPEVLEVVASMFPERGRTQLEADVKKFSGLFLRSIYKWVQSPLSLHIGNLDLDRERALQLPVVTQVDW